MFSYLKHPKTSQTINLYHKANIFKKDCIFHRIKEEPVHTIIVAGDGAFCDLVTVTHSCSYQFIVMVEITDMNGES